MESPDTGYINNLVETLRKRDVEALRQFLKEEAATRDTGRAEEIDNISDYDLESRMYRMILARHELIDLHADARRWLREHDFEDRYG